MKLLTLDGSGNGSLGDVRQLKRALLGCVCASKKTVRTKSPLEGFHDDEDAENTWLLSTQPPGCLASLPEASTASPKPPWPCTCGALF